MWPTEPAPARMPDPFLWRLLPLGDRCMRAWSRRAQQCCMRYAVLVTIVLGSICYFVTRMMGLGAFAGAANRVFANYKQMEAEGMTSADPSALGHLTEGLQSSFFRMGKNAASMMVLICITQLVVLFFVQRSFKRKLLAQMHPPQPSGPDARV